MAAVRGGRGGIEDELVGAAVQISELRQDNKRLQKALASALLEVEGYKKTRMENSLKIQEHEVRRAEVAATHAKELEDVKKNERDAIETAKKACAELQKRNDEAVKLKAELSEARAAVAEEASTGGPANRRRVTATGLKPVSPGPAAAAAAAAAAGGAAATPKRGARYGMDEGEEDINGGSTDRTDGGGSGSGGEEEGEGEEEDGNDEDDDEEEEEEEDDDDDGNKGTGFFGWLTGSAKKRRRGE